jgi:multiple sugar transport system permease protein
MKRTNPDRESIVKKLKKGRISYLMLLPFGIFFLIFGIIPVVSAIGISFTNFNMVSAPEFAGIQNYVTLFLDDPIFIKALKNTVIFAVISGPVGYILSFVIAWIINDLGKAAKALLTLLFYSPTLAGNVYFIWLFIFSGDAYGILNSNLLSLGFIKEPVQWLTDTKYSLAVVLTVVIWLSMGAGFLAFVAGLKTLNTELFEAGAMDGIQNRFQELWYVTLPQMVPQLLFGAVMSISAAFAIGYQNIALTGLPSTDYSTHTLLVHILDYGTVRYEMGYASAVSVFLFALMLVSWHFVNRFMSKLT